MNFITISNKEVWVEIRLIPEEETTQVIDRRNAQYWEFRDGFFVPRMGPEGIASSFLIGNHMTGYREGFHFWMGGVCVSTNTKANRITVYPVSEEEIKSHDQRFEPAYIHPRPIQA
jgi:hypothetical protein